MKKRNTTMMASTRLTTLLVVAVLLALGSTGCRAVPYCIGDCSDGDGSTTDTEDEGMDGHTDTQEDSEGDVTDAEDVTEEDVVTDGPEECFPPCEDYQTCCRGTEGMECVDTSSHRNHCGECGNRCEIPNAYNDCVDGVCVNAGCDINYYDCIEDDPAVASTLGCETVCFRTSPTDEVCDHIDNDCDCVVDDEVDFTTDPSNCGACGVDCRYPNAEGVCSSPDGTPGSAVCSMGDCLDGYHDINLDDTDGCEYECSECEYTEGACVAGFTCCTSGGDETCNGLDDDCDGDVDEGNPGGGVSCGDDTGECVYGTLNCVSGVLTCEGGTGPATEICDGLDNDCDGTADEPDITGGFLVDEDALCGSSTGDCEFGRTRCVSGSLDCVGGVTSTPETCDGHDNDCDGLIDDGTMPGEGATCGIDTGECSYGTTDCVAGAMTCVGGTDPTTEICDTLDNDCDGDVDEDFLFLVDPHRCGDCTTDCTTMFATHAIAICSSGTCTVVGCDVDWWPIPGDPACDTSPSTCCTRYCSYTGSEVCDGVDNDCDGDVDTADSSLVTVPNFCESAGECAGSIPVCTTVSGTTGWFCNYPSTVTVDSGGILIDPEPGTLTPTCDDLDNDCDGEVDEHFTSPSKGDACEEGTGSCRDTGVYVCNTAGTALECDAVPLTPGTEVCNDEDDDCDGVVDDFGATAWSTIGAVWVNVGSGGMYVLQHEASRPNASSCDAGTVRRDTSGNLLSKACSKSGAQPWTNVTLDEAREACENLGTGWSLCSAADWEDICNGPSDTVYPYGDTYGPTTCNGNDYDTDCPCGAPCTSSGDNDEILDTGDMTGCRSDWSGTYVYDMSGNVKEWTSTSWWVDLDGDTTVDVEEWNDLDGDTVIDSGEWTDSDGDTTVDEDETFYEMRGGASNQNAAGLTCDFDFAMATAGFTFFNLGFRCCYP